MNLTAIRTAATVLITALVIAQQHFTHDTWIAPIVAAVATLGIHAIPSVAQKANTVISGISTEVKNVTTPDPNLANPVGQNGPALMGITHAVSPVAAPVVSAEPVTEPAAPTETEAQTEPQPAASPAVTVPAAVPAVTAQKTATQVETAPVVAPSVNLSEVAAGVRSAVTALLALAEKLEA